MFLTLGVTGKELEGKFSGQRKRLGKKNKKFGFMPQSALSGTKQSQIREFPKIASPFKPPEQQEHSTGAGIHCVKS